MANELKGSLSEWCARDPAGWNAAQTYTRRAELFHQQILGRLRANLEDARDAGEALIEARRLVPRGQWRPWLKEWFRASPETAYAYMRIARGWDRIRERYYLSGGTLTVSAALRLLSVRPIPEEDRSPADSWPGDEEVGRTEPIPLPGRLEPDDYEDDIEDVRRRLSAEEERNRVRERLLARAVDAIDRLGARALTAWDRATTQSPGLLYGVFVVFAGQGWYGHDLLSLRADFERAADEYQIDPEAFERLTQRCTECEPDYDLEFEADREDILESEGDLKFEVDPDEDEGASGPRLADLLGDGIGPDEWFDERFDG